MVVDSNWLRFLLMALNEVILPARINLKKEAQTYFLKSFWK